MKIEKQTKNIYVAEDGKRFTNQKKCIEYEEELKKKEKAIEIINIELPINHNMENYIEIIENNNLLLEYSSMLYKNYSNEWCIGELKWESIHDIVKGKTIQEVIYKYYLLVQNDLLDYIN